MVVNRRPLSAKYNDSCIKIFDVLKLLAKGEADFADMIRIFADADGNLSQNSNVLLNKFLNTVKIFGVEYRKSKGKYTLIRMPFSINFSEKDLYAVSIMKSAANFLPEGKNKSNLEAFLKDLQNRYDLETRNLSSLIVKNKNYDLSFYFKKFQGQIKECEDYCANSSKLEIIFHKHERDELIICIPEEVRYKDKIVLLSVFNCMSRQIVDIPLDTIKTIQVLSEHSVKPKLYNSIVFKLKPPLADRYKLRDWEISDGKDSNGDLTVVNSGEDVEALCSRLMRYDDKCEILSPKKLRDDMIKLIESTLKNYSK